MADQKWSQVRDDATVDSTIKSLAGNGIQATRVKTSADAKAKVLELLPEGAEVFAVTSKTLEAIGVDTEINESGKYNATRPKLNAEGDDREKARLGAAPEWVVGSVHAVTEDGKVLIASNTGSQLPADAYSAAHVIWVVGTQKIVRDLDDGLKRIYDYVLPQETVRARQAYGLEAPWESYVSKLLIVNREVNPERITIVFVDEVLGF